jgi:hypothetical protein
MLNNVFIASVGVCQPSFFLWRLFSSHATLATDRIGTEAASMSAFEIYREIIRENIEYPFMLERYPYDKDRIDEIVDLILETVCAARKTIRIAGDDYPAELVKAKFMKLKAVILNMSWTV